jgi:hypothetical protein
MVENTPYYSVTYDDGSSESLESENNLLRNWIKIYKLIYLN